MFLFFLFLFARLKSTDDSFSENFEFSSEKFLFWFPVYFQIFRVWEDFFFKISLFIWDPSKLFFSVTRDDCDAVEAKPLTWHRCASYECDAMNVDTSDVTATTMTMSNMCTEVGRGRSVPLVCIRAGRSAEREKYVRLKCLFCNQWMFFWLQIQAKCL